MPYIQKDRREKLDRCIEDLKNALLSNGNIGNKKQSPEDVLEISGDINYAFSRICASIIADPSYKKIAIITGVLENIKQELYRRLAVDYENQKIESNGDIPEYINYKYK